jgi:hypothetical protein
MLAKIEVCQERADANLKEMKEQMLARLDAKIEDNNEKFEVLQGTLVSRMGALQERMLACLGQTKATDLEVDSAELRFGNGRSESP